MSKSIRVFPPLFLCLFLLLCLVPKAHADSLSELQNAVDNGAESYTLREDTVIPAGTTIDALGTVINIPEGVTLNIAGPLHVGGLIVNGAVIVGQDGFLYVERNFRMPSGTLTLEGTLSIEHDAFDPSQELVWNTNFFQAEGSLLDISFNVANETEMREIMFDGTPSFGGFRRSFWMKAPWTLADDLTLPAHTRICVPYGIGNEGSLLIPAGKTLTIPEGAFLYANGAGPETQGAVVEVRGALVNNGEIELDWGDTLADIALAGGGSYSGGGVITRGGQPYDLNAEHAVYSALAAACAGTYASPTTYTVEGSHIFTLRDALAIPANLSVDAPDSAFEISFPASLTVDSGASLNAAALASLGRTTVDGHLALRDDCRILENRVVLNGTLDMTLDAWLGLWEFVGAEGPDELAARFDFGPDGLLDLWVEPTPDGISASLDFEMFHIDHIRETYCVTFPWTLDHDRELQQDTRLLILYDGEATGMLTIPAGMTFTLPQGGELCARGRTENDEDSAIVRVEGVLINNGALTLESSGAGLADAALINGGIYAGKGTATRGGEPFAIWNDPHEAFLVLPADLRTIGSEALADGGFFSVYFPESVSSIANDVFGSADRMIVYGVPGSAAERFAEDRGFLFAPVAP